MIMGRFRVHGEMPFRSVYFTGIIRDKQGRKMSKSLGNSPDPLDLIAKYGADALRLGVMRSAPLGQDILFDEKNVELGRNFCTKLWNAARFRQMQGGEREANSAAHSSPATTSGSCSAWITPSAKCRSRSTSIASVTRPNRFTGFSGASIATGISSFEGRAQFTDEARKANTRAVMDFCPRAHPAAVHPSCPSSPRSCGRAWIPR